jgi:hypothetical protein
MNDDEPVVFDGLDLSVHADWQGSLLQLPGEVPCLLGDPGRGGVPGAASEMDPPRPHLDEEKDVEGPPPMPLFARTRVV